MTYLEFINNILNTRGRFNCGTEYHERHHINPRCMDGTDDEENLIDLYAREHFIAHKLLAVENPDNYKIVYAWWIMSIKSSTTNERYELTPEEYEEAKVALSNMKRDRAIERFVCKENHPMYGKTHSDEAKLKISNAKKGKPSPKRGCHISEEQKKLLVASHLGVKWTQEQHEKMDGRYSNGNSVCCTPVYCPELDESFYGLAEVKIKYGIPQSNICRCLSGQRKHAGKHPITGEPLSWVKLENNEC